MKITCPDCSTSYEIKAEALGPEGRSVKCAKCGNRWFASATAEEEGTVDAGMGNAGSAAPADDEDTSKDEAEWAADSVDDTAAAPADDDSDDFGDDGEDDEETDAAMSGDAAEDVADPAPAASPAPDRDVARFSEELSDEDGASTDDIESLAKRPKIIVNPNKFRRNHISALINWLFRRNFRRIGGLALFAAAMAVCASLILMRDTLVKQSPDLASLFEMIGFDVNLRGLEFRNLRIFNEVEDGKRILVVEGSIRNLLQEQNIVPAVRLSIRDTGLQEVYAWTVEPRTKSLNGLDETRFRTILADPPQDASDIQVRFVDRGKRLIVLE